MQKPIDNKNYLVAYLKADGTYSDPHRAYYDEEENKFISLESYSFHPLVVDIFYEMPELGTKWLSNPALLAQR